jgi:hypothetical protein
MTLSAIHSSTTLASFETTRVAFIILAVLMIALLLRGNISVKLALFTGFIMGALLPAFWSTVTRYTEKFPSAHLGSGPGFLVTLALVVIAVLGVILFILEHNRAGREGIE